MDVDLHHATLSMGAVERIPGVGYVHTKFLLLMYFPVLPELSELVLDDPTIGGGREVAPVPLNWRSIVVVYARWVIAAPIPFAVYWATEDPLRGGLATAACLLAMAMTFVVFRRARLDRAKALCEAATLPEETVLKVELDYGAIDQVVYAKRLAEVRSPEYQERKRKEVRERLLGGTRPFRRRARRGDG